MQNQEAEFSKILKILSKITQGSGSTQKMEFGFRIE